MRIVFGCYVIICILLVVTGMAMFLIDNVFPMIKSAVYTEFVL